MPDENENPTRDFVQFSKDYQKAVRKAEYNLTDAKAKAQSEAIAHYNDNEDAFYSSDRDERDKAYEGAAEVYQDNLLDNGLKSYGKIEDLTEEGKRLFSRKLFGLSYEQIEGLIKQHGLGDAFSQDVNKATAESLSDMMQESGSLVLKKFKDVNDTPLTDDAIQVLGLEDRMTYDGKQYAISPEEVAKRMPLIGGIKEAQERGETIGTETLLPFYRSLN